MIVNICHEWEEREGERDVAWRTKPETATEDKNALLNNKKGTEKMWEK